MAKTIAQQWQERIGNNSAENMANEAAGTVEESGTWVYIFIDGSRLY
jgi:hypothetical protein